MEYFESSRNLLESPKENGIVMHGAVIYVIHGAHNIQLLDGCKADWSPFFSFLSHTNPFSS